MKTTQEKADQLRVMLDMPRFLQRINAEDVQALLDDRDELARRQEEDLTDTERNRRVDVENYLLQCSVGKRPLPSAEVCRVLALRLGTPKGYWPESIKRKLP